MDNELHSARRGDIELLHCRGEGAENAMSPPDRISLRLAVQRICENSSRNPYYRLVAYSSDQNYRPLQFETIDQVLKALKAVLPEIDANLFYQGSREASLDCLCQ